METSNHPASVLKLQQSSKCKTSRKNNKNPARIEYIINMRAERGEMNPMGVQDRRNLCKRQASCRSPFPLPHKNKIQ
jgi:hypothetical protein